MDEFDQELLATHTFQQAARKANNEQRFEREAVLDRARDHFTGLGHLGMAMIERIETLEKEKATQYDDVKALHEALNCVLALFVSFNVGNYHCVDIGLKALARHPELPVRASLAEKIEKLRHSEHGTTC